MKRSTLTAIEVILIFFLMATGSITAQAQQSRNYEIDAKEAVLLTKEMDAVMTQYSQLLAECYEEYTETRTFSKENLEMKDILVGRITFLANQLKIYYKSKRDKNNLALVDAIIIQVISSHNFIKKSNQPRRV